MRELFVVYDKIEKEFITPIRQNAFLTMSAAKGVITQLYNYQVAQKSYKIKNRINQEVHREFYAKYQFPNYKEFLAQFPENTSSAITNDPRWRLKYSVSINLKSLYECENEFVKRLEVKYPDIRNNFHKIWEEVNKRAREEATRELGFNKDRYVVVPINLDNYIPKEDE